jgi:predicted dehydrogenase
VLLDHGTHLFYLLQDVAGPPSAVHAWSGRLRHKSYDVEDTAQLLLEYPDRLATVFLTWAGRGRETTIRFLGERGVIEWVGGDLKLDSDAGAEHLDYREQLLKASYPSWFAGLFLDFVEAMDRGALEAPLADIAVVASVLEQAYDAGDRARGEALTRSA